MIMASRMRYFLWWVAFWLMVPSCSAQSLDTKKLNFQREVGDPVNGIRIAWDYSSMQRLAPRGERQLSWVGYPRVRRLNNGMLLASYETNGNVELIRSLDNGSTWSEPVILFEKHISSSATVNKANGELIQLNNGDIVAACNYRPEKEGVVPFAIAVKRSSDMGQTWTVPQVIYEAGKDFKDGCWEPAFLQLPSGKLQLYFANEGPYTQSDEQEISMLTSDDDGRSWDDSPTTVCFRKGHRDGMPVPVIVDDEILVAIEDNASGQFKPSIVRSSLSHPWETPVSGDSPNREFAHQYKLPDQVYAGAPYLLRWPSGEVLLSYQTTRGRSNNWELSTMEVAIGNIKGRNFSKVTQPFDVPLDREAKWNSISLWDENTVVAASTTSFRSAACEVWTILGHVIPNLEAQQSQVSVDGCLTKDEWGEAFPVFVGHKGTVNVRSNVAHDNQCLFFSAKIKNVENELLGNSNGNGVTFFVDGGNYNLTAPDTGLFSVFCSLDGQYQFNKGAKGEWVKAPVEGIQLSTRKLNNQTYSIELGIPFIAIGYSGGNEVRMNVKLNYVDENGKKTEESIVHANNEASNTWCEVHLMP